MVARKVREPGPVCVTPERFVTLGLRVGSIVTLLVEEGLFVNIGKVSDSKQYILMFPGFNKNEVNLRVCAKLNANLAAGAVDYGATFEEKSGESAGPH
jgi:hypothetical protein